MPREDKGSVSLAPILGKPGIRQDRAQDGPRAIPGQPWAAQLLDWPGPPPAPLPAGLFAEPEEC